MLVVINVIVFLMCTFSGNVLYNKGELDVVSVLAGKQYGRLLWAMFLHAGIEHIFNNMVLLFFLGAMIEKVTGHVTFLVLYFLSSVFPERTKQKSRQESGHQSAHMCRIVNILCSKTTVQR